MFFFEFQLVKIRKGDIPMIAGTIEIFYLFMGFYFIEQYEIAHHGEVRGRRIYGYEDKGLKNVACICNLPFTPIIVAGFLA